MKCTSVSYSAFCFLVFCVPSSLSGSAFLPSPSPFPDQAPLGPCWNQSAPEGQVHLPWLPEGSPPGASRLCPPPAHTWASSPLSCLSPSLQQDHALVTTPSFPLSGVPTSHHPEMEKPYFLMILAPTRFPSPRPERRHRPLLEVTAARGHHAPDPAHLPPETSSIRVCYTHGFQAAPT